ncbi:MAG: lytic murein transglycosylase [Hyphomicrobiales bacterium]|nr:lytic murein transglycosylase [Hyphomicrobiales bacterium]
MTWLLSQSTARRAGASASLPSRIGLPVLLALLGMLASLGPDAALAQPSRPAAAASDSAGGFQRFIQGLWPLAQARGVSRATFDAALQGLTPDPAVLALTRKQAEFVAPIWTYLSNAVGGARIARGQAALQQLGTALASIEQSYGVPKEIVVAIWGMETSYGSFKGDKDVIRSLATLAAARYRGDFFRDELLTALEILQKGLAERAEMRGSWAGAMGHTQFMPSSYMKHAVAYAGSHADIWDTPSDALASTANYLRSFGWTPGLPWGLEVSLPEGYSYTLLRGPFSAFTAAGVTRASGGRLPSSGEARLFFPAGHKGPVFLLTSNFDVIKTYNSSDAYALGVGHLSDRLAGRAAIQGDWPVSAPRLTKPQVQELQRRLRSLGLYAGDGDGRIGSGTREAVRQYQSRNGLIPDGWPTPQLLARLKGTS